MQSFAARGHAVELFSYDRNLAVPDWIRHSDAAQILPADRVLRYQSGFGRGSPALHANLFRYAMLHQLGGWWVDLDVVMLRDDLPADDFYFAQMNATEPTLNTAVLKAPAGHPMLAEAVERCLAVGESAFWGQTGPFLWTELVGKYALDRYRRPACAAHPIGWKEVPALFDPARRTEVETLSRSSDFIHLFNEVWRGSGIPRDGAPPEGCFLDGLLNAHGQSPRGPGLPGRMQFPDVERWIINRNRRIELEQENAALEAARGQIVAERDAMLASTSWRVTAPLRRLSRLLARS
jgi:hypothetical protein